MWNMRSENPCETRKRILNFETPCLSWKRLGTGGNTWRRELASTTSATERIDSTGRADRRGAVGKASATERMTDTTVRSCIATILKGWRSDCVFGRSWRDDETIYCFGENSFIKVFQKPLRISKKSTKSNLQVFFFTIIYLLSTFYYLQPFFKFRNSKYLKKKNNSPLI